MTDLTAEGLRNAAISLLAQRDYSRQQLYVKLKMISDDENQINQVIDGLHDQYLQNDRRFVENFIRSRTNKGYGPIRISMELRQKGISVEMIEETLEAADIDWFALASQSKEKKFGQEPAVDAKEKAKQMRFLHYRGFPSSVITEIV